MTENYTIAMLQQIHNRQVEQDKKLDMLLAREPQHTCHRCQSGLHGASGESLNSKLEQDNA